MPVLVPRGCRQALYVSREAFLLSAWRGEIPGLPCQKCEIPVVQAGLIERIRIDDTRQFAARFR